MPRMAHIIRPTGGRRSYRIGWRKPGARKVYKIPAFRSLADTESMRAKVERLARAVQGGDPPPRDMRGWIAAMPDTQARALIAAGLLGAQDRRQARPLEEHVDEYERAVKSRRGNSAGHAAKTCACLRRTCDGLSWDLFTDVNEHDLAVWLDERPGPTETRPGLSPASKRHYIQAWRGFTAWMVREKRASEDPLATMARPAPVPNWDRRPFSRDEIRLLLDHLDGFEVYPDQTSEWPASERRLLYWCAVHTGFRRGELASLRVRHLHLDDSPAAISLSARDSKNKTGGEVPIPVDLAAALAEHVEGREEAERVFWLPVGDGAKDWLHRDLEAAGLGHLLHAGQQVDFHSLRATAITWWLQAGLDQLQVQRLARLKTLAVLQRYTRIGQRRMGAEWVMGMSLMTGRGPAGATRKRA